MKTKHTLVLGASLNPERFSHAAVVSLRHHNHPVTAIGLREGVIEDVTVQKGFPEIEGVHTVTLYMNPKNQKVYCNYLLDLHPKRIIFNPGTENTEFRLKAEEAGIQVVYDCTLYLLSQNHY